MKNKNSLLFLLGGIILGVIVMGGVVYFTLDKINLVDKSYKAKVDAVNTIEETVTVEKVEEKEEKKKEETKVIIKEVPVYEVVEIIEKETIVKEKEEPVVKSSKEETPKEEIKENIETEMPENELTKEEISEEIIDYAEKVKNNILTEENINKVLQTAKTSFITLTDFVFYGTEINGYTFEQLTEKAKADILTIVIEIDAKLETARPGYKDEIKLGVASLLDVATEKYLEVSEKICDKLGVSACVQVQIDLETLEKSAGVAIDITKTLTEYGFNTLKSWYEIFRESE